MSSNAFTIVEFSSFDDRLVEGWRRLESGGQVFPQCTLVWVRSWCEVNAIPDLRIICAVRDDRIVGIAPFRKETRGLVTVLRSTPTHFGDFFGIVADPAEDVARIAESVIGHLRTSAGCGVVQIDQLRDGDPLTAMTSLPHCRIQEMSRAHIVQLVPEDAGPGDLFDIYWKAQSKNRRTKVNKAIRLLEEHGEVGYRVVDTYDGYIEQLDAIKAVYISRWNVDLPDRIYEYRNRALKGLFDAGTAKLHIITVSGELVGYHLGFDFQGAFYSWKEANHSRHAMASMGMLMKQYYLPKTLLDGGIRQINYMAGDYEYKKQMSEKSGHTEGISTVILARDLPGRLFMSYFFDIKPALKGVLRDLMQRKPAASAANS